MGAMQNNTDETKSKNGKRGSVNNKNRLDAFATDTPGSGADWGGCNGDLMQQVVTLITELGGAVTFGLSRDNGAHSLTLMLDQNRKTLWFNGDADLDEELEEVVQTLKVMA